VKIMHTSDWHIGKVLKGQSRFTEQIAVLAEIVAIADAERPDLVIVAGDLFDMVAPSAETKKVVVRALTALRRHAAAVAVIAGNHDHGAEIDALRPWADGVGITLRGTLGPAADHVITGVTPAGEPWRLAALPFVSQRYAVRASEMFELTAAEATATYADHIARLIAALTADFSDQTSTVNLATAHLTVIGASRGGGERDAHTVEAYAVPGSVFPPTLHYVALGHLHRRQQVNAPCPVHYSGSPLAVDFGEEQNIPSVSIVEAGADARASARAVPIRAAVALRTVRGTLAELARLDVAESAWLRVFVREASRAGLKEDVLALLPRALEIRIDPQMLPDLVPGRATARAGRAPSDLFAEYLSGRDVADPAVTALFDQLYEEVG
jgi:DNA repair protein SbcD/Mre11